MGIQAISFNGHKKQQSPPNHFLNIALKGGFGAVAGFVAGRYVFPVSDELAERVMVQDLFDSFIENRPQHKTKPKVNKDDVKKETKITTPKAKTKFYYKTREFTLKQVKKIQKSFENYLPEYFEKNGGRQACVNETKTALRNAVGRKFAILGGALFASAAILDQIIKSNRRGD